MDLSQQFNKVQGIRNNDSVLTKVALTTSPFGRTPTESHNDGWDAKATPDAQAVTGSTKLVENTNKGWLAIPNSQPTTSAQQPQQASEQPQ
jgi:hypothetical protein